MGKREELGRKDDRRFAAHVGRGSSQKAMLHLHFKYEDGPPRVGFEHESQRSDANEFELQDFARFMHEFGWISSTI
ncbi:hypothetical protein KFK09_024119 [Dendrobium nobile]|uniref:Uncharacterized protein n=1 Tax=Dendrobium nobile TaxID=94219 RepID=A0A8T3AD04_DENNO|nr:hypothetical protein KFK09_024119 [Dendrobium nobile]